MPSDNIDDSKVVEDVNLLPGITNINEGILVDFGKSIIDEVHMSYDSTSEDVNGIVESNILAVPSKLFKFTCVDY